MAPREEILKVARRATISSPSKKSAVKPRPPSFWVRRATGLTMVFLASLALVLSVLPLPDSLRPFPEFRSDPKKAFLDIVAPGRATDPEVEVTEDPTLDPIAEPDAPPVEVAVAPLRAQDRVAKLEKTLVDVKGRHVTVESFCRRKAASGACEEGALDGFFKALGELERGTRKKPVRVIHFGDSLIASDHITDVVRQRLQERHGDGGRGYLFADRPTRGAGRKVRTGEASDGWGILKITDPKASPLPLGVPGALFLSSPGRTESTRFSVGDATAAEVLFVTHAQGGRLNARVDDGAAIGIPTEGSPGVARQHLSLPPGSRELRLSTEGGAVALYGVDLSNAKPGVLYDSIGLPGSTSRVVLKSDEAAFREQLTHLEPAMVVVMLGGNDALELSQKRVTEADVRQTFVALVDRLREGAPKASCFLVGPADAGIVNLGGKMRPRPGTREVTHLIRAVAEEKGCAYWDMQVAMGGPGSFARWLEKDLFHPDLIHPRGVGGDLIGHLFDVALERLRLQTKPRLSAQPRLRPPLRPAGIAPRQPNTTPHPPRDRTVRSRRGRDGGVEHRRRRGLDEDAKRRKKPPDAGPRRSELPDAGFSWETTLFAEELAAEDAARWAALDAGRPAIVTQGGSADDPAGLVGAQNLSPFFQKLRQLDQKGAGRAAIVQLGASHTAGQFFTDSLRLRLGVRFGDAGRGYVAVGRPSERLVRSGVRRSLIGSWSIRDAMQDRGAVFPANIWGLTGTRAEGDGGSVASIEFCLNCDGVRANTLLQVFYVAGPSTARVDAILDGVKVATLPPGPVKGQPRVEAYHAMLEGPTHKLELAVQGEGKGAVLGAAAELMRPGVVYDALGLPGSTVWTVTSYDQKALARQLEFRRPDLYVLFYGTNESGLEMPNLHEMAKRYQALFSTLRRANAQASCLFVGPTDRMVKKDKAWVPTATQSAVIRALRDISRDNRCAFWSARAAMGGQGSIDRWAHAEPPLALMDHVHLTPDGYELLADALFQALMAAYEAGDDGT